MKSILYIDQSPPSVAFEAYFSKFDFKFIYTSSSLIPVNIEDPLAALLIYYNQSVDAALLNTFNTRYLCPIIVLNDVMDESLCVSLLESGADDFLLKTIHPRELHARINAISRRVNKQMTDEQPEKMILLFEHWRLYPSSRRVLNANNQELLLSTGEYDLLYTLISNPHIILSREFLLQVTKQSELNLFDRRIDVQISRLRQKIEPGCRKPSMIKTIRNNGYLFTATVTAVKARDWKG